MVDYIGKDVEGRNGLCVVISGGQETGGKGLLLFSFLPPFYSGDEDVLLLLSVSRRGTYPCLLPFLLLLHYM